MTPLLMASGFLPDAKSRKIVQLLLEHGADPNFGVEQGDETALSIASLRGYPKIVNLLLEAGADPNMGMEHRWGTALHPASGAHGGSHDSNVNPDDRQQVVRLLLEAGADPNIEDDRGKPALSYALENDHEEVAQMLRQAGAREVEQGTTDQGENRGTDPYERIDRQGQITEQTRDRMMDIRRALVDYERDSTSYPESLSLLLQHIRRDAILSTRQDSVFGESINLDSLLYSPRSGKRFQYAVSNSGRVETYLLEDPDTDDQIGTLTGDPTQADAASWE